MSIQETDRASAAVAVAPRVKLSDIEAAIKFRFDVNAAEAVGATAGHKVNGDGSSSMDALRLLSICILVMQNGFTVIGKSAPASPENFNVELGQRFAYDDAVRQLWPLMGFALRDRLTAAASVAKAEG